MNRFSQVSRAACTAAVMTTLAACSEAPDAANQEPVSFAPGKYYVALTGKMLGFSNDKNPQEGAICVRQNEVEAFPHTLVQAAYGLHPNCTMNKKPRVGNAITGVMTCPVDPKLARGATQFIYTGEVRADSVTTSIQMKVDSELIEGAMSPEEAAQLKVALKVMERARIIVSAKRTGDCA